MTDIAARYDAFQQEAVRNIVDDFREAPTGRFLLVIPTGGGKTKTAVKALGALFTQGVLGRDERVVWLVHRDELRTQALSTIEEYSALPGVFDLFKHIDVLLLSGLPSYLATHPEVRFAVIDEAHHGAAASYQPLFARPSFGILGLTATPSRHDGQPLPFDRESYSIGFPDLVSLGVLLQPHVVRVEGGAYDLANIQGEGDALAILNNEPRNQRILKALGDLGGRLTKVIVYVGTQQHARDLFALIRQSSWASNFQSLALMLGGVRRRVLTATGEEIAGEGRQAFIQSLKAAPSALIVNVDVLTEGYDDPAVNAVVMARPTKSKLVYMQAIGRAVRLNPQNLDKEAYIVEVVDELPNIRYRIDNRWLYSDVSDLLEPAVQDRFYSSKSQLASMVEQAFADFQVPIAYRVLPDIAERDRVTMLLFRVYIGPDAYEHIPLIITNATRQSASGLFNFLSLKMKTLRDLDIEASISPVLQQCASFSALATPRARRLVFHAMQNAFELVNLPARASELVHSGHPWITFVAFRLALSIGDLPGDLLEFTEEMFNKESVREALRTDAISPDFALVKLPLPLRGCVGVFLSSMETAAVIATVKKLRQHADEIDGVRQWTEAMAILGVAALPIESRHIDALTTIVREDMDYYRWLTPRAED